MDHSIPYLKINYANGSINLHKLGSFILCHQTSCHKTSQTYEENRKILAFYTKYN